MSDDATIAPRKKIGRPLKRPPKDAARRIEELARDRNTKLGIARTLNVSKDTLNRWFTDDPALQDAFDRGRDVIHQSLASKLLDKALAGETVPLLFALKAMFGWREGESVGQGGGVTVVFKMPEAMPMKDFLEIHERANDGTQSLSVSRPVTAQRG